MKHSNAFSIKHFCLLFLFAVCGVRSFAQADNVNSRWFHGASVNNSTKENQIFLLADHGFQSVITNKIMRSDKKDTGYIFYGKNDRQLFQNEYALDSSTLLSTFGSTRQSSSKYKGTVRSVIVKYFAADAATLDKLFKLSKMDFAERDGSKSQISGGRKSNFIRYIYVDDADNYHTAMIIKEANKDNNYSLWIEETVADR